MTSPEDKKEQDGLVRSIERLFREREGTLGPEEEEPEDGSGGSPAGEVGPDDAGDAPREPDLFDEPEDLPTPAPPEVLAVAPAEVSEGVDTPDEEMVWEEVEEPAHVGGRAADADPEALAQAVARFLESPPLERDGLARTVRSAAADVRKAHDLEPLADAVERLTASEGEPDEAPLAMARSLMTPGVAARLAARLGLARDEGHRQKLLRLCRLLGPEMAESVAEALAETSDRFARRAYLDALVQMGDDAAGVIEGMSNDPRWFVVRNAVSLLGEIGGERAVELVTGALAHGDSRVRREALLALARLGGEDAGMLVYGMLEDSDPEVRLAAAMAAGALKVARALKPLLAILDDEEDEGVVTAVLQALGQLGDPGAVNSIEKKAVGSFFSKPPADVRIAAYRALHRIGTPHAMQVVGAAADDKDPAVRSAARRLFGKR